MCCTEKEKEEGHIIIIIANFMKKTKASQQEVQRNKFSFFTRKAKMNHHNIIFLTSNINDPFLTIQEE